MRALNNKELIAEIFDLCQEYPENNLAERIQNLILLQENIHQQNLDNIFNIDINDYLNS